MRGFTNMCEWLTLCAQKCQFLQLFKVMNDNKLKLALFHSVCVSKYRNFMTDWVGIFSSVFEMIVEIILWKCKLIEKVLYFVQSR